MTRPASRLPGRPDERAASRRQSSEPGGMQVVVAVALGAAVLASVAEGDSHHPPEPAPTWNSPPCRSGGDNSECARSGG
ncbi:DUF6234 family protein [Streptomyces anulatus]|uniref:DUF6234 family protein n=1 Tax=Streptomyces anulatus TaxID=1892 RepID=A0ABZ1ZK77_STRAQ|nr:DUF6234 family protein [Streptomyces anulatus]WSU31105.1 DUF6234 family protein [Streptomyces anulatus]